MVSRPRSAYKDISEADWQDQIVDTLHLHGWKVAHFRTSMTAGGRHMTAIQYDARGFPDLVCTHAGAGDVMVIECKREYEQATPEQLQWLTWFEAVGIDAYVYRPSQVDEMIARVAAPQRRVRRNAGHRSTGA